MDIEKAIEILSDGFLVEDLSEGYGCEELRDALSVAVGCMRDAYIKESCRDKQLAMIENMRDNGEEIRTLSGIDGIDKCLIGTIYDSEVGYRSAYSLSDIVSRIMEEDNSLDILEAVSYAQSLVYEGDNLSPIIVDDI